MKTTVDTIYFERCPRERLRGSRSQRMRKRRRVRVERKVILELGVGPRGVSRKAVLIHVKMFVDGVTDSEVRTALAGAR